MRVWAVVLAVLALMAGAVGLGQATPEQPNLSGYAEVAVPDYLHDGAVYFHTPDGLSCALRPSTYIAGCDGALPAAPPGANEIALAPDTALGGYRQTANPQFGMPGGTQPRELPVGHKIVYEDYECAVDVGAVTMCTKAAPTAKWFVLSPAGSGLGPRTAGLPDNVPDPNDFVVGDESYVVGSGAKNLFPLFIVGNGLTCKIAMYSGGEIGCDGPLPGLTGGQNEIFAQLPGDVGMRKTDTPHYSTPAYPGPIRRLPAQHRVTEMGGTCMATPDGGVACYGTIAGATQGFVVSPGATFTFG
jgi:hypothetical protein